MRRKEVATDGPNLGVEAGTRPRARNLCACLGKRAREVAEPGGRVSVREGGGSASMIEKHFLRGSARGCLKEREEVSRDSKVGEEKDGTAGLSKK